MALLELVFGNSPMVRDLTKMKLCSRKFRLCLVLDRGPWESARQRTRAEQSDDSLLRTATQICQSGLARFGIDIGDAIRFPHWNRPYRRTGHDGRSCLVPRDIRLATGTSVRCRVQADDMEFW